MSIKKNVNIKTKNTINHTKYLLSANTNKTSLLKTIKEIEKGNNEGFIIFDSIDELKEYYEMTDSLDIRNDTEYLLSTEANRESLLSAVESINCGDWKEWKSYSMEDLEKDLKDIKNDLKNLC